MRSQNTIPLQPLVKNFRGGLAITLFCLCSLIAMSLLNLTVEDTLSNDMKKLVNLQPLEYNTTKVKNMFTHLPSVHTTSSNESVKSRS